MIRRIVVTLCCVGCAQAVSTAPVTTTERSVMTVVRQALENDAAGIPSDDLYTPGATVINSGADYTTGNRFAGMGPGGLVRISDISGDVSERFAWASVAYRWMSQDGAITQSARASFILQLIDGRWRIRHAHSSLILPWQRELGNVEH